MEEYTLILQFTNILITLYSVGFATRFLSLTRADNARKPWEYLTYSIIALFFLQVISFLKLGINELLTQILTLIITGLILTVFIYQDYFMKKKNFETLTRKEFVPIEKK